MVYTLNDCMNGVAPAKSVTMAEELEKLYWNLLCKPPEATCMRPEEKLKVHRFLSETMG